MLGGREKGLTAQLGSRRGRCRWEHCTLKDPFAQVEVEEDQCGGCRDSVR